MVMANKVVKLIKVKMLFLILMSLILSACSKQEEPLSSGIPGLKLVEQEEIIIPSAYTDGVEYPNVLFHLGSQNGYTINLTLESLGMYDDPNKLIIYLQYDAEKNAFTVLDFPTEGGIVDVSIHNGEELFYVQPIYNQSERLSTGTEGTCQYYSKKDTGIKLIYEQKNSLAIFCSSDIVVANNALYFIAVELRNNESQNIQIYRLFKYSDEKLELIREFTSTRVFHGKTGSEKIGESMFFPNLYPARNGYIYNTLDSSHNRGLIYYVINDEAKIFPVEASTLIANSVGNKIYYDFGYTVQRIEKVTGEVLNSVFSLKNLIRQYELSDHLGLSIDSHTSQLIIFNPDTEKFWEVDLLSEEQKARSQEKDKSGEASYSINVGYAYFSRLSDEEFMMTYTISEFNRETLTSQDYHYYRIYKIEDSSALN